MSGWIKIHRQVKDNAFCYGNAERLGFWIQLLLMANREEKDFYIGRQKVACKAGQFATGREKLSEATGLHSSKIERHLDILTKEGMIEQQMNSKFRIITIKKWNDYQVSEQQLNNKRTTVEQQLNTNKKREKLENEKKPYYAEMFRWLQKQSIQNPQAYVGKMLSVTSERSVKKAWGEMKRGTIDPTPASLFARAEHYSATISPTR